MMEMLQSILEIATEKWIEDINDIQINNLLKWINFYDSEWKNYTEKENKEIRKSLIHFYVWMDKYAEKIYWTTNVKEILKKVTDTKEKLEKMAL